MRLRPPDRAVIESFRAFVLDRLTQRREIVDVRTSVIFNHFRRSVVTPAGD